MNLTHCFTFTNYEIFDLMSYGYLSFSTDSTAVHYVMSLLLFLAGWFE